MKTFFAIAVNLGFLAAAAVAQPKVTQISNAASFSLSPLPNSSIAQGSYFAIFGTGLGADISTCGSGLTNCIWHPYPLPTSIGGTSVSVTVGGTTVSAFIELAFSTQINAVLPSTTPAGSGTLTVTYNGATSATAPITVVANSFGTFSLNEGGSGPGIITDANYAILTQIHTAKPGDAVILWGTGLGPAPDPATEQSAPPAQINQCGSGQNCPVTVMVGNQQAKVLYAGRAGFTAEDQIVFQVPTGTYGGVSSAQGCYVQVALVVNSITSNFTSMPVDPTGPTCKDGDGINFADISSAMTSKGKASIAAISLLSNYVPLNLFGSTLPFDNDTVNGEIVTLTDYGLEAFQGVTISPSVNNCTVSNFLAFPPPKDPVLNTAFGQITYLDAGSALQISGGQGPNATQSVAKNADGNGYGTLVGGAYITCPAANPGCPNLLSGTGSAPYFLTSTNSGGVYTPTGISATTYTVTGPGGSVVGAFSGSIPVSSAAASFKWSSPPAAGTVLPRNQDLTVSWTGGDPNGYVDITLISSSTQILIPSATTPGVLVECLASAGAGSFTIPHYVLATMPATVAATVSPIAGEMLVGPASGAVPITPTPSGLDAAYLFYHFISGVPVGWN